MFHYIDKPLLLGNRAFHRRRQDSWRVTVYIPAGTVYPLSSRFRIVSYATGLVRCVTNMAIWIDKTIVASAGRLGARLFDPAMRMTSFFRVEQGILGGREPRTKAAASTVWITCSFLCTACAFDLAHVKFEPAQLAPPTESGHSFALSQNVHIDRSPCNYDRTLLAGTRWLAVGSIPEGEVYRSPDQVLTVECSHVYETYIVVRNAELVGAYLPVEDGYVDFNGSYPLLVDE